MTQSSVRYKTNSTNAYNRQQLLSTCPMQYAMEVLHGRWKFVILWYIYEGTNRFSRLKERLPQISSKMLTQQLHELEDAGLIRRVVVREKPLHVEYFLSDAGSLLAAALQPMKSWGESAMAARGNSAN